MKINKNDPRLTAYLLNELSAEEKAQFDKWILEDSDLKKEVEILKQALKTAQGEPSENIDFSLTSAQRNKIFAHIKSEKSFRPVSWRYACAGLIAAGFAFLVLKATLKTPVNSVATNDEINLPAHQPAPGAQQSPSMAKKSKPLLWAPGSGGAVATDLAFHKRADVGVSSPKAFQIQVTSQVSASDLRKIKSALGSCLDSSKLAAGVELKWIPQSRKLSSNDASLPGNPNLDQIECLTVYFSRFTWPKAEETLIKIKN